MASAGPGVKDRKLKIQQHPFFLNFGISDEEVRRLYKLQEALNRVPVDETAFKYDKVHAFVGMNMSH